MLIALLKFEVIHREFIPMNKKQLDGNGDALTTLAAPRAASLMAT